jgi:flagellar assembly protein FliH
MSEHAQNISKFTFDTEFRTGGGTVMSDAARARLRKSLTQEEINAMCAEARDAGLKDGSVRAAEAVAAATAALDETLHLALENSAREIEHLRAEAAEIALAAAGKMARSALDRYPTEAVEETLREAIRQAINEPRLSLRASPQVIEAIKEKLDAIAGEHGFEGRIHTVADANIAASDCRIEWRGAGIERKFETIEAEIAQVIGRFFSREHQDE